MANPIKKLFGQVFAAGGERSEVPAITDIAVSGDGEMLCQLHEGRWVRGRFAYNGEQPTQLGGERPRKAIVYGRKGGQRVAVNIDDATGHGAKGKLRRVDADALRDLGFKVPPDDVVQWTDLGGPLEILLD